MSNTWMVRLQPHHTKCASVKHPMLTDLPPALSRDDYEMLVAGHLDGHYGKRERLIMANLRVLSKVVGRYIYNWPLTKRFVDEMVSEGLVAIIEVTDNFDGDPCEFLTHVMNQMYYRIEEEVARIRGVAPASPRTNRRRQSEGFHAQYGGVETNLTDPVIREFYGYIDEDLESVDIFDTLKTVPQTSTQEEVLCLCFEGKDNAEIAEELNLNIDSVSRLKQQLVDQYLNQCNLIKE